MITAIDSSVLLGVLTDSRHADASEAALRRARQDGGVILSECVLAEIRPAFRPGEIDAALADWQLTFVPSSRDSALLAGEHWTRYLARGGKARRVLPDFLIGAHAAVHADRLLARDRGYLRDYFSTLTLWEP